MDFIGDRLQRSGLPVLPSENTPGVLHRQPGDDPQRLRRATRAQWIVRRRAIRTGAAWEVRPRAGDGAGVEPAAAPQTGRASCWARVLPVVPISGGAGKINK